MASAIFRLKLTYKSSAKIAKIEKKAMDNFDILMIFDQSNIFN